MIRVGIAGAGHIAIKAARTLAGMADAECVAVASRSLEKAAAFAAQWGIPRPYEGYDALFMDPDVDLIYIALPHSIHYEVTRRAILAGKPCLVEKPFMLNATQAREILELARQRGVFVAEAIWTRYLPVRQMVDDIVGSGAIGRVRSLSVTLSYNVAQKERISSLELGGGALLDLGVYCLNFVRMFGHSPISAVNSRCTFMPTGPDASETVIFELENGVVATAHSSVVSQGCNIGVIEGETGYIVVDDTNNAKSVSVRRKDHVIENIYAVPPQITGFEYEFEACREALMRGELEVPQMPHSEILVIMDMMDSLRASWGLRFPGE
ncbi:MAG: Gfo/Idh/MocA family oxidoreductase [Bacteroidales bacterium]|nr:Gfo/Idh/MocA family oxidoreductase [Bacteroidales bacterium]